MIIAIDPGNIESAYCVIDSRYRPIEFDKCENDMLLGRLKHIMATRNDIDSIVIEMVASYGMAVGKEVFETCVWIGRFLQFFNGYKVFKRRITRLEVKSNICHAGNARDSNVRQALVDRFAKHDLKRGKGTKKNPDWFYGFADDIWQAYALGVTALDTDEPAYKEVEDDVMRCSQCGKLVCSTTVICPRCGRYLN